MVKESDGSSADNPIPDIQFAGKDINGATGSLSGRRFYIVVSTYHWNITGVLLSGAIGTLRDAGVEDTSIDVLRVPGAWELPLAAARIIDFGEPAAILCLGCVIRGETTHDQHINSTVANHLGRISTDSGIPVAFGLLTCNTLQQALDRAGGAVGNKGHECAEAAIQMVRIYDKLQSK